MPAYDQVIMLRKYMIKNKVEDAIANGTRQIVFLGGGYDIRALITALHYPEVSVFEIDRGPTREQKLKALKTIPSGIGFDNLTIVDISSTVARVHHNLRYIDSDLSQENLLDVLCKEGFNAENKVLVIAEGLTMYLDREANLRLLSSFNELPHSDNQLLLSYKPSMDYFKTKIAQTASNELFKFSLHPREVVEFAAIAGLNVCEQFASAAHLEEIGDTDASYYNDPNKRPEFYYMIKKNVPKPCKTIDEVPEIQLHLPPKPVSTHSMTSSCSIL